MKDIEMFAKDIAEISSEVSFECRTNAKKTKSKSCNDCKYNQYKNGESGFLCKHCLIAERLIEKGYKMENSYELRKTYD